MPQPPVEYLRSASKADLQNLQFCTYDRASVLRKQIAEMTAELNEAEATAQLLGMILEFGPAIAACPDPRQLPMDFNPPQEIKFTPQVVRLPKEARRKRA